MRESWGNKRIVTKRELILFLIFAASLFVYCVSFVIEPRIVKLKGLENLLYEIKEEKLSYEQLYKQYLDYDKILEKYNELLIAVPANDDMSKFIMELEKLGDQLGITIISITPQDGATASISEIEVKIIPCEIKIGGDIDVLLSFVSWLENYPRVFQVSELQLTKTDDRIFNFFWMLDVKINLYYFPQLT